MERSLDFRNLKIFGYLTLFDFCRLVHMHTGIVCKSILNYIDSKYTSNYKCFTIIVR